MNNNNKVLKSQINANSIITSFTENLPQKPYCSNDLGFGLLIRDKNTALTFSHIQHNKHTSIKFLVFDCDFLDVQVKITALKLPQPNIILTSPLSGHSHIFYALKTEVYTTRNSSFKALKLLSLIQYALTEKLEADFNYSGLISKNPTSLAWEREVLHSDFYQLSDFLEYLTLPKQLPKKAENKGFGRNVSLFNAVRHQAYALKAQFSCFKSFSNEIEGIASEINKSFPEPLILAEIKAISRSVSKWTWKYFDVEASDIKFKALQSHRAKILAKRRAEVTETLKDVAMKLRAEGMSIKQIANYLEVTERTIRNYLNPKLSK